ncbi:hypothetical protein M440DRAFT_1259347 [Trichoderma longibrachiatum ATCC 18648]|uniref:Uncharacterized protein n=1 Tax=Trichoderma longibrachiatum ATCC 18648 TaxID=983965 RepID=A0A2T4C298_TRILO|nr:hypothetical protein M440DRAFT_1259347 [Trichoderma longibrachiatum ATCC 18648]
MKGSTGLINSRLPDWWRSVALTGLHDLPASHCPGSLSIRDGPVIPCVSSAWGALTALVLPFSSRFFWSAAFVWSAVCLKRVVCRRLPCWIRQAATRQTTE